MNEIEFTIVVPVYKSVETLEPLFHGVVKIMAELGRTYEAIFVEDSGNEASWQELLRIKNNNPDQITIIRLSKNFGQNGATLCGIDEAKGEKVITLDDDLEIDPKEIKKLIEFHETSQADVIYGKYPESNASRFRKWGGKLVKRMLKTSIGSSFRLIDVHVVEKLRFHSQDHLFINQVISWYTINIHHVEIERTQREKGRSGYSLWMLIKLSLRLILSYSSIPLKLMILLSGLSALCIFGMFGYYLYFTSNTGTQFDLFMIAVLISMAIIAGSIAVFGVYINRIYASRVRKPSYAIKAKL